MVANEIRTWGAGCPVERDGAISTGCPVRLPFVTWPTLALLSASVAACLLGGSDWGSASQAGQPLIGHVGTVRSIEFRPDGAMLSSVGFDGAIATWERTTRPAYSFLRRRSEHVLCADFSPDNRTLAVGSQTAAVALQDLVDQESRALEDTVAATAGASCLAFSPDGATLAVGQQDGTISLWDTATRRIRSTLDGHSEFVPSLDFSPDGFTLASSGGDHCIRIWDLPTGRERFLINGPACTLFVLGFSPDGALLLLGDRMSAVVRLWNMATATERTALSDPAGDVLTAAISPDGTVLAVAHFNGLVTFWDLATLKIRGTRLRHAGVCALAFAPDGRVLATGGFDGAIHLWDLPSFIGD